MKIEELLEDINSNSMPHLYLDMDGVQADFFGAWAKDNGVDSYKKIPNSEESIKAMIHKGHDHVYNFFRHLSPLRGGQRIINWLNQNNIPFTVLSAPLSLRDINGDPEKKQLSDISKRASIEAKKDWLDQFNPGTSSQAIFTGNKAKYAPGGAVLVDDFGKYIDAWRAAGGIGVKHDPIADKNADRTISELEQIYAPYLDKNTDDNQDDLSINETVKKVKGKWALVSKTTGHPLQYYHGAGYPSKEWISKVERRVHSFSEDIN